MASQVFAGRTLIAALEKEGLLPPNCGDITVDIPVNGPVRVRYVRMIEDQDIAALVRALAAFCEDAGVEP